MNLTSKRIIKNLLKKYGVRPFKGWGQNFLVDKSVLKRIIDSVNLKKSDVVLEIGPGIGTLTQELAKRVKRVIAVEKDQKMIEILKETLKGFKNVKIIQVDILNFQFSIFNFQKYRVIANLPYYITSAVIRKLLENKNPPKEMILMVQKEVAQRICAKPPDMNLLAVSVQFYAKPEILFYVPKTSFWPQPKVNGAVIKVSNIKHKVLSINKDLFFKIVKAGFSHPRKQLINNLLKGLAPSLPNGVKLNKEKVKKWLLENNIKPTQRAETLKIEDWFKLTKDFKWKIQK